MKTIQKIQLDFSGGPKSWFDLWHTHVEWDGKGNKDWAKRRKFLTELMTLYAQYKSALKKYPHDFQIWISIDDSDSEQDAVYIHTKNPNGDNFPVKLSGDKNIKTKNKELKRFLDKDEFEIIRHESEEGDVYCLFERGTGINLN